MTALLLALLAAAPAAEPTLSVQTDAAVPGGLLVLDVHGERRAESLRGRLLGERLHFFTAGPHHQRAIVGISLDQQPGKVDVEVEDRHTGLPLTATVEIRAKEFRKSELKVNPRFVKPPKSEKQHIAEDHKAIAAAYRSMPFGPAMFVDKLSLPRDSEITAHFGDQRLYNGKKKSAHQGTDFDGKIGEPIHAAADGVVVLARPCYYSGNTVFVAHGAGLFTQYFHMTHMDVQVGQHVKRGEQLGVVGKTGRVTGPHLHLGLKVVDRLVDAEEAFKLDLGLDKGQKPSFTDIIVSAPDGGAPEASDAGLDATALNSGAHDAVPVDAGPVDAAAPKQ